jgi:hypothetical protein
MHRVAYNISFDKNEIVFTHFDVTVSYGRPEIFGIKISLRLKKGVRKIFLKFYIIIYIIYVLSVSGASALWQWRDSFLNEVL